MKEIRTDLIYSYHPLSNLQLSKDEKKVYYVTSKTDLKNNDYKGYFACVKESEQSSRNLLKNAMINDEYEGSQAEAIDISNEAMDYEGASKINGGGFGGSIICVVPLEKLNRFLDIMKKRYGETRVFVVSTLNKEEQL